MKIYGNDNTNLALTNKAFRFYSGCDPLRIVEREIELDDDSTEYRYDITGIFCGENMTAEEVNEMLENLADQADEI